MLFIFTISFSALDSVPSSPDCAHRIDKKMLSSLFAQRANKIIKSIVKLAIVSYLHKYTYGIFLSFSSISHTCLCMYVCEIHDSLAQGVHSARSDTIKNTFHISLHPANIENYLMYRNTINNSFSKWFYIDRDAKHVLLGCHKSHVIAAALCVYVVSLCTRERMTHARILWAKRKVNSNIKLFNVVRQPSNGASAWASQSFVCKWKKWNSMVASYLYCCHFTWFSIWFNLCGCGVNQTPNHIALKSN